MARRTTATAAATTTNYKRKAANLSPPPPPPLSSDEEEGIYTVERIVQKKIDRHGRIFYLIKWEGYPSSQNTWEAAEDVFAKELIEEFEEAERKRTAQTADDFRTPSRAKLSVSPSRSPLRRHDQHQHQQLHKSPQKSSGPAVQDVKTISRDPKDGSLLVHFRMTDGSVSTMPTSEANLKYPQILLKFYESRLNLKGSSQKKATSPTKKSD